LRIQQRREIESFGDHRSGIDRTNCEMLQVLHSTASPFPSSSITLLSLSTVKRFTVSLRPEGNDTALRKVKNIACLRLHLLAGGIGQRRLALKDDLHFMVVIAVYEFLALFEAVNAARDGLVVVGGGVDVAKEVIVVGDEGRGELGGGGLVVLHRYGAGGAGVAHLFSRFCGGGR
jgi:hypothetical protein